jgi:hypothetical protein
MMIGILQDYDISPGRSVITFTSDKHFTLLQNNDYFRVYQLIVWNCLRKNSLPTPPCSQYVYISGGIANIKWVRYTRHPISHPT